jgi:hypothetical protein
VGVGRAQLEEEGRLYHGPPHRWALPDTRSPVSFALAGFAAAVVLVELALVAYEYLFIGTMRPGTARLFGAAGIVLLIGASGKSVALGLRRVAGEALDGLIDTLMPSLWRAHFWLAPLAVLSFGLFLLATPTPQPPFYHVAYGVLLWQGASGLLACEALPVPAARTSTGRAARAAHHQPAVYVVLAVLVVAGFVDAAFP